LDDDGRQTVVLLSVQHAFEMLLKAVLAAKKDKTIFDKKTQQSVSLEGSIRRCQQLQAAVGRERCRKRGAHAREPRSSGQRSGLVGPYTCSASRAPCRGGFGQTPGNDSDEAKFRKPTAYRDAFQEQR
jgi:hypothetical protein